MLKIPLFDDCFIALTISFSCWVVFSESDITKGTAGGIPNQTHHHRPPKWFRISMVNGGRMAELALNRSKTALGVIDLQKGVIAVPARPYSAQEVIKNATVTRERLSEKPDASIPCLCGDIRRDKTPYTK
jgi:hypothetical protein